MSGKATRPDKLFVHPVPAGIIAGILQLSLTPKYNSPTIYYMMQLNIADTALSNRALETEELYLSETIQYLVEVKDSFHDRSQIPHRDKVYRRVFAEHEAVMDIP